MAENNTTATPAITDSAFSLMLSDAFKIPSACVLICLSIIGTISNLLPIISFLIDRKLRKRVYDFFIFNLAVIDFSICSISIPMYILYMIEGVWSLGRTLCTFWLVTDFTLTTVSTIIILILSADRLLMFRLGPRYNIAVTMPRAIVVSTVTWAVVLVVYGCSIIWWNNWTGGTTVDERECYPEFNNDATFTTTLYFIDTILPFFGLATTNGILYYKIYVRNRPESLKILGRCVPKDCSRHMYSIQSSTTQTGSEHGCSLGIDIPSKKSTQNRPSVSYNTSSNATPSSRVDSTETSTTTDVRRRHNGRYKQQSLSSIKAAKLLASLVVVYVICLAPYTVTTLMVSFLGTGAVNPVVYQVLYWWLWVKSAVNPYLYSFNSRRYRINFTNIIKCQCLRKNADYLFSATH